MRHQMSERHVMTPTNNDSLHHSKSVPNLLNKDEGSAHNNSSSPGSNTSGGETSFSYLDPDKRMRVTDNTLKLIQKQALLEYYERNSSKQTTGSKAANGRELDSGFYSPIEGKNNNNKAARMMPNGDPDEILPAPNSDQVGNIPREHESPPVMCVTSHPRFGGREAKI